MSPNFDQTSRYNYNCVVYQQLHKIVSFSWGSYHPFGNSYQNNRHSCKAKLSCTCMRECYVTLELEGCSPAKRIYREENLVRGCCLRRRTLFWQASSSDKSKMMFPVLWRRQFRLIIQDTWRRDKRVHVRFAMGSCHDLSRFEIGSPVFILPRTSNGGKF